MRYFRKQRTRLLIASASTNLSRQLSVLLSGHQVLVNPVSDLNQAIEHIKIYRHPILFLDEELIPGNTARVMSFFQILQKGCLVVVLAKSGWNLQSLGIFAGGVYDIIPVPLDREDLRFRVKRMINHHRLLSNLHFLRLSLLVGTLLIPPIFMLL